VCVCVCVCVCACVRVHCRVHQRKLKLSRRHVRHENACGCPRISARVWASLYCPPTTGLAAVTSIYVAYTQYSPSGWRSRAQRVAVHSTAPVGVPTRARVGFGLAPGSQRGEGGARARSGCREVDSRGALARRSRGGRGDGEAGGGGLGAVGEQGRGGGGRHQVARAT